MRDASQKLEKEAPALWANLAEFREELVPQAPHSYGTERAYLKHLELLVYLRALRVTLAATLHDSSCRVDIVKVDQKQGTGWEGNGDLRNEKPMRREDREGLQRRLQVVDAFLRSCQQWRDSRLEATERKPRLYRLARAYELEVNGRDDRLFTCLCVMAACQTDATMHSHRRRPRAAGEPAVPPAACSELEVAPSRRRATLRRKMWSSCPTTRTLIYHPVASHRCAWLGSRSSFISEALPPDELLKTSVRN